MAQGAPLRGYTSYKIFLVRVVVVFGIAIVVLPWLLLMMNLAVCVKLFKTCRLSRRVGRLLLMILRFQTLGYGYDPGAWRRDTARIYVWTEHLLRPFCVLLFIISQLFAYYCRSYSPEGFSKAPSTAPFFFPSSINSFQIIFHSVQWPF